MEKNQTQQKKLPKLTKKMRGFVNDYVLEENGVKASLNNYNIGSKGGKMTEENKINIANAIAVENLQKPIIQEAIEVKRKSLKEALVEEGIDEKKIAYKINVLLNATTGENEKPDVNAIDKGLKHAKEIYGVEDSDKPKENVYNFFFDPKFQQNIKNYDQHLKEQILNKDVE